MPVTDLHASDPGRLGPYELRGRLGSGGMGVVYLGRDRDGTLAAVKVIRADLDGRPELRERFRREVQAARMVARFCTAPVLGADLDGAVPWIASEYVSGPTLQDVVVQRGPLSGSSLEGLAVGVAGALAAIHAAGVVHRDLKPANVLLGEVGPRVIDFGIARHDAGGPDGGTRAEAGTPAFMAPEQHEGEPVGPAADVFAWAATMVFAGTGRLPFGSGPAASMAFRVVYGEPDLEGLDGRLLDVVRVCLAKDPEARPSAWTLLTWLTGDGTDPADAAAAVLRRRWAGFGGAGAPERPPASAGGPGGGRGGGARRPRGRVLVAGALAGLLWIGAVAAVTAAGARSGERPPPPAPAAGGPPPPSTIVRSTPATTILTPEIGVSGQAPARRPAPPATLPGAKLLLADDFATKANGWPETSAEETPDGSSAVYSGGGLRLVTLTDDLRSPVVAADELRDAHVELDAAFGGDALGAVAVLLTTIRVDVRRDGRVTVSQAGTAAGPRKVLGQATSDALRGDGFNRVAATYRAAGADAGEVTVTVNGERAAVVRVGRPRELGRVSVGVVVADDREEPAAVLLDNFAFWGVPA